MSQRSHLVRQVRTQCAVGPLGFGVGWCLGLCFAVPLHSHDQPRSPTVPALRIELAAESKLNCKAELALGGAGGLHSQRDQGENWGRKVTEDGQRHKAASLSEGNTQTHWARAGHQACRWGEVPPCLISSRGLLLF